MQNTLSKRTNVTLSAVAIIAFLALIYIGDLFIPPTSQWNMLIISLEKGAIYALVAVSMNLLNGFTGLFSLGQAGFMLIGTYAYAIFAIPVDKRASVYQYYDGGLIQFSVPEMLTNMLGGPETLGGMIGQYLGMIILIIFAGLVAAVLAFFIGLPVLRLKSDYLAIATLGFAEILRAFFQWDTLGPITNGSNLMKSFTVNGTVLFPTVIAALGIAFIVLLINSSYGRALKAIRDDEIAAEAMGVNLFKHKQWSFVISSFFAGVGGALLAMFNNAIGSAPFTSNMTYELLLIVVIGGIGSVTGSIIGAYLFVASSEWWLRGLDAGAFLGFEADFMRPGFRKVVFAAIIMLIVLFYRQGIMGTKEFSWDGLFHWIKTFPRRFLNWIKTAPGRFAGWVKALPGRIADFVCRVLHIKRKKTTKPLDNEHTAEKEAQ